MKQIWTTRNDPTQGRIADVEPQALTDGQVRVRVERFALTANNLTYAAFGESMQYWQFYPTGTPDFGIVPVWGFAQVVQSMHPGVAVGERLYGYWPLAEQAVLTPVRLSPQGFFDGAAHRVGLHAVYNRVLRCSADAWYRPQDEGLQAVLRPLFVTSWLIADFLADQQWFGSRRLLLSSASSKTAWGTAWALRQGAAEVEVIGLTSPQRRDYCLALGLYSQVLCYDDLEQLEPHAPVVYVDFAGNAGFRRRVHESFPALAYDCAVGGTHVDQLGGAKDLPGPKPALFFAPAQVKRRQGDWGAEAFEQRLLADWWQFVAFASQGLTTTGIPPLHVLEHRGIEGALEAYRRLVGQGGSGPAPNEALVVDMIETREAAAASKALD